MKTVKKIMALILLVVGFVACDETEPPKPEVRDPSYEQLTGGGTIRVLQNETLNEERQQFHLEFEGTGGSNVWEDFRLTMQHDEWYGSENEGFVIYNGTFRISDADGMEIFSGTYTGSGSKDDADYKHMNQQLTIRSVHTNDIQVVGESIELSIDEMPDDSYRFVLNGPEFRPTQNPI